MKNITLIVPIKDKIGKELAESFKKQGKKTLLITEKGNNPSINRNKGIKKARTEFVAFTNGHSILSLDWADRVLSFFSKYAFVDIVGGPQLSYGEDSLFAKISGYALSSIFGSAKVSSRYEQKKIYLDADETSLTSANLICRKKVFKKVKFNEQIYPGEDPKFIEDAKKAGFKVAYSPDIVVYNRRRESISGLMKQVYNYGKTRPLKERLKDTLKKPYFLIPSIFLIYLVLMLEFVVVGYPGRVIFIPLYLYLILNVYFSLTNAVLNKSLIAVVYLPFIFLAIHISYGIGFIIGLIKRSKDGLS